MATSLEVMSSSHESAKAAHVNMMTDTIIANLPPEGLRSVLRGLLGVDNKNTSAFESLTIKYLDATKPTSTLIFFTPKENQATPAFHVYRARYRCLMGCGKAFESLQALFEVVRQVQKPDIPSEGLEESGFEGTAALIDSDLVQAITAVHKQLSAASGLRPMTDAEQGIIQQLQGALDDCDSLFFQKQQPSPFFRGSSSLGTLLNNPKERSTSHEETLAYRYRSSPMAIETMKLGDKVVPRMFMGLWQFSSPAWGTAPMTKILKDFQKHVDAGFAAYDMADHYGDAERTFGEFRRHAYLRKNDAGSIYCATKWCVFEPITVTQEVVKAAITERLTTLQSTRVELLQFHWQDYNDRQYVEATKLIEQDSRVDNLGLCNFDTEHMGEIIGSGVKVISNQVQFSLIDLRPTFKMADSCRKHNVKLLTYGSLCGGLLADRWLGKPAPNLFDPDMTPSSRKYFEMITVWGGWALFQELLSILSTIGKKHNVSISIVAVRWVLEHDYVGAAIIGARMGVSEHVQDNLKAFGFKLDEEDLAAIQKVLNKSRAREVFDAMGDCGAEYRQ
ncbi:aldo/keto reductase-like protein [Acephala macrosclerotiorum]|nr:aldo/keto reductase-like protein [Acephala macrosclerotiorum]